MNKTQLYTVISTMAIYHNNQRFEQGDKLELTDEEAERISLYVKLDDTQAVENAVTEADVQAAEAHIAEAEKAKGKGKKGE